MGTLAFIWRDLGRFSDEELLNGIVSGGIPYSAGYAACVLQERQHFNRTYRRRKMLAKVNRFFQRRNQERQRAQPLFRIPW